MDSLYFSARKRKMVFILHLEPSKSTPELRKLLLDAAAVVREVHGADETHSFDPHCSLTGFFSVEAPASHSLVFDDEAEPDSRGRTSISSFLPHRDNSIPSLGRGSASFGDLDDVRRLLGNVSQSAASNFPTGAGESSADRFGESLWLAAWRAQVRRTISEVVKECVISDSHIVENNGPSGVGAWNSVADGGLGSTSAVHGSRESKMRSRGGMEVVGGISGELPVSVCSSNRSRSCPRMLDRANWRQLQRSSSVGETSLKACATATSTFHSRCLEPLPWNTFRNLHFSETSMADGMITKDETFPRSGDEVDSTIRRPIQRRVQSRSHGSTGLPNALECKKPRFAVTLGGDEAKEKLQVVCPESGHVILPLACQAIKDLLPEMVCAIHSRLRGLGSLKRFDRKKEKSWNAESRRSPLARFGGGCVERPTSSKHHSGLGPSDFSRQAMEMMLDNRTLETGLYGGWRSGTLLRRVSEAYGDVASFPCRNNSVDRLVVNQALFQNHYAEREFELRRQVTTAGLLSTSPSMMPMKTTIRPTDLDGEVTRDSGGRGSRFFTAEKHPCAERPNSTSKLGEESHFLTRAPCDDFSAAAVGSSPSVVPAVLLHFAKESGRTANGCTPSEQSECNSPNPLSASCPLLPSTSASTSSSPYAKCASPSSRTSSSPSSSTASSPSSGARRSSSRLATPRSPTAFSEASTSCSLTDEYPFARLFSSRSSESRESSATSKATNAALISKSADGRSSKREVRSKFGVKQVSHVSVASGRTDKNIQESIAAIFRTKELCRSAASAMWDVVLLEASLSTGSSKKLDLTEVVRIEKACCSVVVPSRDSDLLCSAAGDSNSIKNINAQAKPS